MDETSTTFLTPAALAASISLHVPTLSTACAASFILSGLPGTNPTAMTRLCAPDRADARASVESAVTSSLLSSTPALSMLGTLWTIAPRTTVDASPSFFSADCTFLTPATTLRFGRDESISSTLLPVWPVAPATTTVGAAGASSSAPAPAAGRAIDRVAAAVDRPNARRETETCSGRGPPAVDSSDDEDDDRAVADGGDAARGGDGTNAPEGQTSRAANARNDGLVIEIGRK
mmetsp:Transcript_28621/g.64591  ORF Transcript_28621/g.64591 Transcript_28621/m.64591 type:complete len:232 (+) Transcript_28621:449-1144(+)